MYTLCQGVGKFLQTTATAATGTNVAYQVGNDINNNIRQNNYNDTNNGINGSIFSFFCSFFVTGRSNIPESANNKEQDRDAEGNAEHPGYNRADKSVDRSSGVTVEPCRRVAGKAVTETALSGYQNRSDEQYAG